MSWNVLKLCHFKKMSWNVLICLDICRCCHRAYSHSLLKSVPFRCHYNEESKYPSYDEMSKHLNKTNHKVSFLVTRENVGSTTFTTANPTSEMQHSFGIPRFFFRFNLTSAISRQPYGYVHWAMFKVKKCHRTSFEGSMSMREWTTGPVERSHISPFCYLEDVVPSRFALGTVNVVYDTYLTIDNDALFCIYNWYVLNSLEMSWNMMLFVTWLFRIKWWLIFDCVIYRVRCRIFGVPFYGTRSRESWFG